LTSTVKAEVDRHPGFLVLRLTGNMRLWGHAEIEENLLKVFHSGLDSKPGQLVLNLSGLSNIDTLGIAALVRVLIESGKRKLDLKMVMPKGAPGEALRCVRVFEPWPEFKEEKEAVEAAYTWANPPTSS